LPAGPQFPEPGRFEPAGVGVGHGAHGASSGQQDAIDPRQALRARTPLSDRVASPTPRAVLAARARHGRVWIRLVPWELLLDTGDQAGRRESVAIRGSLEDLSATDSPGRVPAAGRWRQERPLQPPGTAATSLSAQASPSRLSARGTATAGPGS